MRLGIEIIDVIEVFINSIWCGCSFRQYRGCIYWCAMESCTSSSTQFLEPFSFRKTGIFLPSLSINCKAVHHSFSASPSGWIRMQELERMRNERENYKWDRLAGGLSTLRASLFSREKNLPERKKRQLFSVQLTLSLYLHFHLLF